MFARHSSIFIVLFIFLATVWGKPQQQHEEQLPTRERRVLRLPTSNLTTLNGGQPFYGIYVTRINGVLRTIYKTNASANPSRPNVNRRPDESVTSAIASVPADCAAINRCKRDSIFVFPNDNNETIAKKCETTFCEDTDEYPFAMVEQQLRKDRSKFSLFFGEDKSFDDDVKLTQRINGNDGIEDIKMCRSVRKIIYPRKGVTIDNDWKFIVNQNDSTQGVVIELCDTELEGPCLFSDRFPVGYRAVCKQHYVYRQLISFSEQGSPFEKDYFKMPSCCQCVVNHV